MGNLAVWIMSMIGPVVRQVLLSLGLGWITFEGTTLVAENLRDRIADSFGQVNAGVYDLLAMAGFIDAVGITLGAIFAIVGLMSAAKLGKMLT